MLNNKKKEDARDTNTLSGANVNNVTEISSIERWDNCDHQHQ